jgi:hypothetical protein
MTSSVDVEDVVKKSVLALGLALLLLSPLGLFATDYDHAAALVVMHGNLGRVQAIKAAIASGDFYGAAQAFFDFAKAADQMQKMDPPKGPKEDWMKVWASFQDTALKGVGFCGDRDPAGVQKSLDTLLGYMKGGHGEFKG